MRRSATFARLFALALLAASAAAGLRDWSTRADGLWPVARTSSLADYLVQQPPASSEDDPLFGDDEPKRPEQPAAASEKKASGLSATERRRQAAARRQRMLERIWNEQQSHQPSVFERGHASVKAAFREAVSQARRSTVLVFCDGKQVALGAVVRADGLIATKLSELKGKIECAGDDGARRAARVVASDAVNDLALLKVDAMNLTPVKWLSAAPSVGSWLATSGPGVDPIAVGVVSVAAREIRPPRGILGVLLGDGAAEGARIDEVLPESAAEEAGLEVGDVVAAINGQVVSGREAMIRILGRLHAGNNVTLKLKRAGKEMDVAATLGNLDMGGLRTDRFQMMNQLGGPLSQRRAGFSAAIQHDTILLPHDCGGPIVDVDGRVVGINIARAGRVDSYALPAAVVEKLVNEQPLRQAQHVTK